MEFGETKEPVQEPTPEEGPTIKNWDQFVIEITNGNTDGGEKFLAKRLLEQPENIGHIDKIERKIFNAHCRAKNWVAAKIIVEASIKGEIVKPDRKARLEELSGLKYDEI